LYEEIIDSFEKIIGFDDMKAFSLIYIGLEQNRPHLCKQDKAMLE
jgi:hypothetical protein